MWFDTLPSAGGYAPLWQVEHCAVTVTCVWFHFVGFHCAGLTLWQLKQFVPAVGMCVADSPVAVLPLWQLAQLVVALKVLWSTLADDQVVVEVWQLSQAVALAWIAVLGLPAAL